MKAADALRKGIEHIQNRKRDTHTLVSAAFRKSFDFDYYKGLKATLNRFDSATTDAGKAKHAYEFIRYLMKATYYLNCMTFHRKVKAWISHTRRFNPHLETLKQKGIVAWALKHIPMGNEPKIDKNKLEEIIKAVEDICNNANGKDDEALKKEWELGLRP
jgi:hypothetical protein